MILYVVFATCEPNNDTGNGEISRYGHVIIESFDFEKMAVTNTAYVLRFWSKSEALSENAHDLSSLGTAICFRHEIIASDDFRAVEPKRLDEVAIASRPKADDGFVYGRFYIS